MPRRLFLQVGAAEDFLGLFAMARPLRIEYDGALYHVTSRGNERKVIFKDDGDRHLFLGVLAQVTERFHWICHAYCLMNNHYHLVIETPDGNLSKGNAPAKRRLYPSLQPAAPPDRPLFQGKFKAILVQKESHYLEVCRYVVLNAVRAKTVKLPREWPWSSYRATSGVGPPARCLAIDELLTRDSGQHEIQHEIRVRHNTLYN
jgi:putative transposase